MYEQTKLEPVYLECSNENVSNLEGISKRVRRGDRAQEFISFPRKGTAKEEIITTSKDIELFHTKRKRENEKFKETGKISKYKHELVRSMKSKSLECEDSETEILNNVPWMKITDRYYSHPIRQLHEEILDLVDYLSMTEDAYKTRLELVSQLEIIVKNIWSNAKLKLFGSFATTLYLPTSDMDITIFLDSIEKKREIKKALVKLADQLKDTKVASSVKVILKAKVPIVKMVDRVSGCTIDFTFNVINGVTVVPIIKKYIKIYPAVRPLVMVLKLFLKQRGLNEVFTGGISSFSLTLMVISLLQLHPRLQTNEIKAEENLGIMLIEFFELYGRHFNYKHTGISIKGQGRYFKKSKKGWNDPAQNCLLALEDPQDENNNVAGKSFNIMNVRQVLQHAFFRLTFQFTRRQLASRHFKVDSLLRHIISVPFIPPKKDVNIDPFSLFEDEEPLIVSQASRGHD
jgi:non-canonical poly(A) RNA polymerase PAPD5/7